LGGSHGRLGVYPEMEALREGMKRKGG